MIDRDVTLKMLKMRSMRRGIREMDLILQAFAAQKLNGLSDEDIALYEALLSENDQEIYSWVTGGGGEPPRYEAMMNSIRAVADGVVKPA